MRQFSQIWQYKRLESFLKKKIKKTSFYILWLPIGTYYRNSQFKQQH
jgi:hypothetical protein